MLISMRGTGNTLAKSLGSQPSQNSISKPENVPRECGYLAEFWIQPPRISLIFPLPAAAGHQLTTAWSQEVQETLWLSSITFYRHPLRVSWVPLANAIAVSCRPDRLAASLKPDK